MAELGRNLNVFDMRISSLPTMMSGVEKTASRISASNGSSFLIKVSPLVDI